MTTAQSLIAFIAAAGLLTLTPGVDTAMVVRAAMVEGRRSAGLAAIGIGLGCLVLGAAVALGLGAIVTASPPVFMALKWLGTGYLLYLGAMLLLKPRRSLAIEGGGTSAAETGGALDPLRRGLFTNLLNPKVGVFYVSFLPQFTPTGAAMGPWVFMLACLHVALGLIWFAVLIAATIPISRWLARPGVVTVIDRLTGCVFIGFGARLAAVG
jgi:threonine/homoserine/homoserine lactone efflux protein